jgi:ubiquinone/menaquinone biosynthesis C-methylase UbiE
MKKSNSPKSTSWGGVASWYDEMLEGSSDSFQTKVILPNLIRILDPKKGMSVLDVACGQGFFARAFVANGAKVTACDISPELINIAKKSEENSPLAGLTFMVAPADKLAFATDESFDAVTVILALQNIENLAGTLAECARVLKPGGRFVAVVNHPAFRVPKSTSWVWDEKASVQYRRVDSYMSDKRIEIDMTPGEEVASRKKLTVSFHRPFQSYFKAMNKCGLAVTRLEEWISHKQSQKGSRAAEEDRTRKEIPMFLMLEAIKD